MIYTILSYCRLIGACILLMFAAASFGAGEGAVQVAVMPVVSEQIHPQATYLGTIIGENDAALSSEIDGRIDQILEVGDHVAAGNMVAGIDAIRLRLERDAKLSEMAPIKAQLEYYQKEVERLVVLVDKEHISQSQLDAAIARRDELDGQFAMAQAQASLAKDKLARTVIYSPFSGIVVERFKSRGEYVSTGDMLVRLVDTATLEVRLNIPHHIFPYANAPEHIFTVTDDLGHLISANFLTLVPVADKLSRLYELRLRLPASHPWMTGQAVQVAVPVGAPRAALLVSQDALVIRRSGISLFRVLDDMTAQQILVKTGATKSGLVEVSGALNIGDLVVTRGNELLRPGQTVVIQ